MSHLVSDKKRAENQAIADENYQKAKKKAGTTLLRWKPDWEQAARFYREAVKYYKLAGDFKSAIQAAKESAVAHEEINSLHTAAADLELAAQLTLQETKNNEEACDLYKRASQYYRTNGSHDKSAAMLVKAAESIGEVDINAGIQLMKDACAVFEEENRGEFHDSTFKKAIAFCLHAKKYSAARNLMLRQNAICQKHISTFEKDIYKNLLCIIVIRFHTENYEKAQAELREFEAIERFSRSDEYRAADALVQAFENGSEEELTAACKLQVFKYLPNQISILVRKFKFPDDVIQHGGKGGRPLEDDEEKEVDLT